MSKAALTPQEYEEHLKVLRDRLRDYVDKGVGNRKAILREAEQVLGLAESYPEVMARYGDVEGLLADILAHEERSRSLAGGSGGSTGEPHGCLLGWLFGRRG